MRDIRKYKRRGKKVQALSLARECVINKMELLTNATVVDDAIRFVSEHTANNNKEKLISSKEKG